MGRVACELKGGGGADGGQRRGVGGLRLEDAAAGELEGEFVVADEELGRDWNAEEGEVAVGQRQGRRGDDGQQGVVETQLEGRALGWDGAIEVVGEVEGSGARELCVREGEVDAVIGVRAAQLGRALDAHVLERDLGEDGALGLGGRNGNGGDLLGDLGGDLGADLGRSLGGERANAEEDGEQHQQRRSGDRLWRFWSPGRPGIGPRGVFAGEQAAQDLVKAGEGDADDAGEAEEGAILFAVGAVGDPGVGAGVEGAGEDLLLGDGLQAEFEADLAFDDAGDQDGDLGVARLDWEGEPDGLAAGVEAVGVGEEDGGAADGEIAGDASHMVAVGELGDDGNTGLNTDRGAALLLLVGDGGGNAENHHVEEDPAKVGEDGARVSGIGDEEAVRRGQDAEESRWLDSSEKKSTTRWMRHQP
jgi:hypothetical protein